MGIDNRQPGGSGTLMCLALATIVLATDPSPNHPQIAEEPPCIRVASTLEELGRRGAARYHLEGRPRYAPHRIVFKLADTSSLDDPRSQTRQAKPRRLLNIEAKYKFVSSRNLYSHEGLRRFGDICVAELPPGIEPEGMADKLRSDPSIEWAEPDYYRYMDATVPNDTLYPESWHLERIDAPAGWDVTTGDPNIVIAVIDTGVNYNHPDLFDNIWVNPGEVHDRNQDGRLDLHDIDLNGDRSISQDEIDAASNGTDDDGNGYVDDIMGWDFVDDVPADDILPGEDSDEEDNNPIDFGGHGTAVAGTAAAVGNNGTGIAGVAWNSRIMVLRAGFADPCDGGHVLSTAWCKALKYAADNGTDIVNMSFAGPDGSVQEYSSICYAVDCDCMLVAGSGNERTDRYPNSYEGVISVSATDDADTKTGFSNFGMNVDIAAPGADILTTSLKGYSHCNGTSFSSPLVAGSAALVKSRHPLWDRHQITTQMLTMADDVDPKNPSYVGKLGSGRINVGKALNGEYLGSRLDLVSQIIRYGQDGQLEDMKPAELYATIRNYGYASGEVSALLSSDDPNIVIERDTAYYGGILSQRKVTNFNMPYILRIAPNIPPGYTTTFVLRILCNGILVEKKAFNATLNPYDPSITEERPDVFVEEGSVTVDPNSLSFSWGNVDRGQIDRYDYAIGTAPDQIDEMDWEGMFDWIDPRDREPTRKTVELAYNPLVPYQQYYVSLKSPNSLVPEVPLGFSAPVIYYPASSKGTLRLEYNAGESLITLMLMDVDLREQQSAWISVETDRGDREIAELAGMKNTGVFRGSILVSKEPVAAADGALEVAHGELVSATYRDADNGEGKFNAVIEIIQIDHQSPEIHDVAVNDIYWADATIQFRTNEPAYGTVRYGLSPDSLGIMGVGDWDPCQFTIQLDGLEPDTVYYFAVEVADSAGNHAVDDNRGAGYRFQTLPLLPVIYVDDDGPEDGYGNSWGNACKYLQNALMMADLSPQPVEIRVAQGMYPPDRDGANPEGTGKRSAVFRLGSGHSLKGGYAGLANPSDPNHRDIELYETILSGDLALDNLNAEVPDDISQDPAWHDNAYGLLEIARANDVTLVEGLVFSGSTGRCVFIDEGSPRLEQCCFRNNATGHHGLDDGVLDIRCSNPMLAHCTFTENRSQGCAIYNSVSRATFEDCVFCKNTSTLSMLHNVDSSTLVLNECRLADNTSGGPGGAINNLSAEISIAHCTLERNHSNSIGGAIISTGGHARIKSSVFRENDARQYGGALFVVSPGEITNCLLLKNTARTWAAICDPSGQIAIAHCVFVQNESQTGGVLRTNSTVSNCILWGNVPSGISSPANSVYSFIQDGIEGEGNIDVTANPNPLFADPNNGDYHLKSQAGRWDTLVGAWVLDDVTSPCIDAGDPNSDYSLEPLPNGGRINIGVYGGTHEASKSP